MSPPRPHCPSESPVPVKAAGSRVKSEQPIMTPECLGTSQLLEPLAGKCVRNPEGASLRYTWEQEDPDKPAVSGGTSGAPQRAGQRGAGRRERVMVAAT